MQITYEYCILSSYAQLIHLLIVIAFRTGGTI